MFGVEENRSRQRQRPQRLKELLDLYAPGVWDWDLPSNAFTVTDRLRQIFGLTPSIAVDLETILAVTHPDDRSWAAAIREHRNEWMPDPLIARFRILRADNGEMRWISSRIWRLDAADAAGSVGGYLGAVVDVTEEAITAAALAQSEQRLRLAIEAGKMAVWEVDLESGAMTQSTELNLLFGYPTDTVMTLELARACYNPGEIERLAQEGNTAEAVSKSAAEGRFEPRQPGALKSGANRTQVQAEVAITTRSGQPRRLMLRSQYAVSPEGRPRLTGLLFDITETKMAEERIALVAHELKHRVKNSLSVIGAIAQQSFRSKTDTETGLRNFMGRIGALSAANDLILSSQSKTADVRDLIDKITQPYHTGPIAPFVLEGPAVELQPLATTAVGMVLHELCTNAVKYGALSAEGGRVALQWTSISPGVLQLTWRESGGPPVTAPARRGFGFRLLENVVKNDLNGALTLDFNAAGFFCRIEIQVDR
jgi:PAS domain S-box-containing protein